MKERQIQPEKKRKGRLGRITLAVFSAVVLIAVIYIMAHGIGLIDSLDFGAGAYYYADIPAFAKFVNSGAYQSKTPMWALILLFLAWGALMYKLWIWVDKKCK